MSWADEYLCKVAAQIRVKRIRTALTDELRDHMELQKADFLDEGLTEAEAERRTIEEMGDALLVGGELDRAHRPEPQWKGMLLALLLMLIGMLLRTVFTPMGQTQLIDLKQCAGVCIAMGAILLLGTTDYMRWIRLAVPLTAAWGVLLGLKMIDGPNLISYYLPLQLHAAASSHALMLVMPEHIALAAPLLTGLMVGRKCGGGWNSFLSCLSIPVLTLLLGLSYTWRGYIPYTVMLLALVSLLILALAVKKGFFVLDRRGAYGCLAALAAMVLAVFMLNPSGAALLIPAEFMKKYVYPLMKTARMWGEGRMDSELLVKMEELYSEEQMIPFIIYRFGWMPFGMAFAAILLVLILAARQYIRMENRIGSLLGLAALIPMSFQILLCCLHAFASFRLTLGLPLISYGTIVLWLDAAMVGIMLSALRGEHLPEGAADRKKRYRGGMAA